MEVREAMDGWPTGRLLSTAARMVEHAWADALDKLGLTHAGLIVLDLLDKGSLSQAELAKFARVQAQTISRTLDRLDRDGLVTRVKHPEDGRRHVVARTESGRAVWLQARTLEADMFPAVAENAEVRAALLDIIRATTASRWNGRDQQ
jgi:DNA-binding MarR family transcriptional regulator